MDPLHNVQVLDVTQALAGPYATMQLADLGADVVKIEKPGSGDITRSFPPFIEGESSYFHLVNRNKKSVVLDLRSEEGANAFKEMAKRADVIVENYKPGTMAKFGIDYESIKEINENVVYCSISGYGQSGPYKTFRAVDGVVQAFSGNMSITGPEDGAPHRSGFPIGDIAGTMYAVQSIILALYHRERTGEGQYIDVSLADSLITWSIPRIRHTLYDGTLPNRGNNPQSLYPLGIFETKDDPIFISAFSDGMWHNLCETLDRQDLIDDDRFDTAEKRYENREALDEILEAELGEMTAEESVELLAPHIAAAPINDFKMLLENKQVKHRDIFQEIDVDGEEYSVMNHPVKFSSFEQEITSVAPRHGAHTEEVLKAFGIDENVIERMVDDVKKT